MTDDALRKKIGEIAKDYNNTLTDKQTDQLVSLCRTLEKMDANELLKRVNEVKDAVQKMAEAKTKAVGFIAKVQQIVISIVDFFQGYHRPFQKISMKFRIV